MQEFSDHYGPYMEILYLITKGDLLRADEVFKKPADEIVFFGEYLLWKRKVEAKSNKKTK